MTLNGAPHRKTSEGLVRGVRGKMQDFLSEGGCREGADAIGRDRKRVGEASAHISGEIEQGEAGKRI